MPQSEPQHRDVVKIGSVTITSYSVLPGGDRIVLNLADANGQPVEMSISTEDAGALVATFPQLLTMAAKTKYWDDSWRYVFPLDGWRFESASDGSHVIVTLGAKDSVEVSFLTTPDTCQSLGSGLQQILKPSVKRSEAVVH